MEFHSDYVGLYQMGAGVYSTCRHTRRRHYIGSVWVRGYIVRARGRVGMGLVWELGFDGG